MEYRESLEEQGIRSPAEIERKVAIRRSRLQSEYGLLDSKPDASGRSKRADSVYIKFLMSQYYCYIFYYGILFLYA